MKEAEDSSTCTRREFLRLTGVGVSTLALSSCGLWQTGQQGLTTSLPRATRTDRMQEYLLDVGRLDLTVGEQSVSTWVYNGAVPGPELRLTEGNRLRVMVRNHLPEETTIHWHGLPIPNSMDGVPDVTQQPIKSGEVFIYDFVAPVAGTYFYHSHMGLQSDRGLYGPLIIEPVKEAMSYDREFVLVLDDWLDGLPGSPEDAMKHLMANGKMMGGMNGMGKGSGNMLPSQVPPDMVYPLYLINGKPSSAPLELSVKRREKVRLRFINASAATIYRVALAGHRMTVTHTDGQPVEPVEVDTVRIGMGERYDVLLWANHPGVWQLAAQAEGTTKMVRAIFRYKESTAAWPPAGYLPAELTGQILRYSMLEAAPGVVVPPGRRKPDRVVPITLSSDMGQYVWTMNGQAFPQADQIAFERDRFIRFQLYNMSMMSHPVHLHGHSFQVENGTGHGPLKDTVLVEPMQQLTLDWISDNPGRWAFHCHNLYHMMAGMMRIVKVG
ncbi:MAG: multicopper oxidase family protein [Ktedonobacteraceae bacterium]